MEQLGSSLKSAPSVTSLPDVKHYSVPDHWMHIRFVGNRRKRTISRSGSETEDSPVIPMFGATVDREKAAWTEEEMMCHDNGIFVPPQSSLRSSPSIDWDTGRQTPVMAGDQMTLRAYVEQSQRVDFHQRTNSGIPAQTKDKLGRQTKVKPKKSGSLPNSEPGISALARVIRSEKEVDVSPDPNEGPKPNLHGPNPSPSAWILALSRSLRVHPKQEATWLPWACDHCPRAALTMNRQVSVLSESTTALVCQGLHVALPADVGGRTQFRDGIRHFWKLQRVVKPTTAEFIG
eukprot:Plantae.Rhodophyta-Rhodochaete_pulchella.ctg8516.p1 GENE.Plantae.Rhodophyta-Rhodochaete_pulchella.ctg8516~~Plantae.Rhodophyta-Rhodochaete_pulchella.ctg8516.p1  ORF type:complete len:290 (-),score=24.38 Plantae.Rhodophyta-Rhodochaete_pulchella.ctg8516:413-1282(-)